MGLVSTRLVRRLVWGAAIAAVLALATAALLPLIASTQLVRSQIAHELEEISGYRVTLGEAPELVLWPQLGATLNNVSFYDRSNPSAPYLQAEHIDAGIAAWQALFGRIELGDVTLRKPTLRISLSDDIPSLPGPAGGGRIEAAIAAAVAGDTTFYPALGKIRLVDGQIVNALGGDPIATNVGGTIEWTHTGSPATASVNAVWRGQAVSMNAFLASPINLAKGTGSDARLSFGSKLASAEFVGSIFPEGQTAGINGDLKLSTSSLHETLKWVNKPIGPASNIEEIKLSGRADGTLSRLKLEEARLQFEEYPGTGALEFSIADGVPAIAGTLDFARLDFGSIFEAFSAPGPLGAQPPVNLDFTDQLALDVRLSAAQAGGAGISLSNVAAALQVRQGFAAFDISDATGFGGTVQAGYRAERKTEGDQSELRLSAADIDWTQVGTSLGWTTLMPRTKGSFAATLSGPVADWASFPRLMTGVVSGRFLPGTVTGVDLTAILALPENGGFEPLSKVAKGSTQITGAEFKATLNNGIAALDTARIQTAAGQIDLLGVVSYTDRSLALSASIQPAPTAQQTTPTRSFYIGGSWNTPYLTPTGVQKPAP